MQGIQRDEINVRVQEAITKVLSFVYGDRLSNPAMIEDIILFTPRRKEFPNIGTESVNMKPLKYLLENMFWINVCLYVNGDFRACFNDAITIEKALLNVDDEQYRDFRDDMTLDEDDKDGVDKKININFSNYASEMDVLVSRSAENARKQFFEAGMTEVYNSLADGFDRTTANDVVFVINNLVYVINAFNRNGVFRKYVTLVVDNVKSKLSN